MKAKRQWKHPAEQAKPGKYARTDTVARLAAKNARSRQWVNINLMPRLEPAMDADGYPTEHTLKLIRTWPIRSNFMIRDLYDYCARAWNWGQDMWGHAKGGGGNKRWIEVSTGGWSGNESIITALQSNHLLWSLCWLESRRGGHYRLLVHPISDTPTDEGGKVLKGPNYTPPNLAQFLDA